MSGLHDDDERYEEWIKSPAGQRWLKDFADSGSKLRSAMNTFSHVAQELHAQVQEIKFQHAVSPEGWAARATRRLLERARGEPE